MEAFLIIVLVVVSAAQKTEAVLRRDRNNSPSCECVPYYECIGSSVEGGSCSNFIDVCCQPSDIRKVCTCVPYYECTANTTDPLIDNCSNFLDVCCPHDKIEKEFCTCVPYYECTTSGSEFNNKSKCLGEFEVCCNKDTGVSPFSQTPPPPTPPLPPVPSPLPVVEPCSTIGTRKGICIPYSDCLDKLQEPVRLLTLEQFVHNYGCGLLRGISRVCCPVA